MTERLAIPASPRLGAAYYNEYLPDPSRLDEDLRLMAQAGIRCIRVGESVWSTWEPQDGVFDLEWLTPVLDGAAEHGIDVILGTPTYAVPPWLSAKHPELAVRRADGSSVPWGGRQEVDYTSPTFRLYAERVIRRILSRHGRHRAVIGVQVDNEAGLHLIHNDEVVQRFRTRLSEQFDSPHALNEAWGLTYWSHRISSWDELWTPAGNTTPAYNLAWRRFQAEQTAEFIDFQARIARELVAEPTFITTCIAYQRPAMDDVLVGASLDIASGNAYAVAQDAYDLRTEGAGGQWYADDVTQLVLMADRMRATKHEPFLVTETGAGHIGAASLTRPPYRGQLAQTAWLLAARGARLVSYWHWHSLHSGAEVHWGGILGHDLQPGRIYREIAEIGAQFERASGWLTDAEAESDIAIVIAHDSEWTMAFEPSLPAPGDTGDRRSYSHIVRAFAQGAIDAGHQLAVINERQLPEAAELLRQHPVVIAAGLISASDATLQILAEYTRLGGRLIVGPRTGYGDDQARMRTTVAPGALREVLGLRYSEFAALAAPVPLDSDAGVARGWIDCYEPDGAEVLARYDHPHFGEWAALTRNAFGDGVAYAVGSLVDRASMKRLLLDALPAPTRALPVAERPETVTAHSLRSPQGRVWVLHNWSPESVTVSTARGVTDVLANRELTSGATATLAAWGVAVWADAVDAV